ncbi:MAG: putative sugar O-methyltransferase [Elusimicrobia bacterium]|nr:putative sugar O-methyltransferase [Elusimicrobiota bacterium]
MKTAARRAPTVLYDEVRAHYASCGSPTEAISDTWTKALEQKGRVYPPATMLRMLELGNRVNLWIDDFNYLIDATALEPMDAVTRRLLKIGESDFGHPRRDLRLGGRTYSSNFIHTVIYAAKIIAAAAERGIERPRVLEIGGGLGVLAYLLRSYYGKRLTYYAADLPETLMIQEWYLRSCFPEAATSYKGTANLFIPAESGLNFVNAYRLQSQDFTFDVAINIDSMQEMDKKTSAAYIRYIERNISDQGFFFFQNHYGHTAEPTAEPSEYPLDARWTLRSMELSPQVETCAGAEQARIIYDRTQRAEDAASRRLILRLLWNGFMSNRLLNDEALVGELAALPKKHAPAETASAAEAILRRRGAFLPKGFCAALIRSPYFPHRSYADLISSARPKRGLDFKQSHVRTLWSAQSELIRLMRSGARRVGPLLGGLKDTPRSEFWSTYFASMLAALGQTKRAAALAGAAAARSQNPFWLARFAHILERCGSFEAVRALVKRLAAKELDFFLDMKTAELEHGCGLAKKARQRLLARRGEARADAARAACLARTAARLGHDDIAEDACAGADAALLLDVLRLSPAGSTKGFVSRLAVKAKGTEPALGFLALALGAPGARRDLETARLRFSRARDYFRLAQMGSLYQRAGLHREADACLRESFRLRTGAFLHQEFIGGVYFRSGRYARARTCYASALRLKPYLRRLLAKHAYCGLKPAIRNSGIFGRPTDLRILFPISQDFYHDLGPGSK